MRTRWSADYPFAERTSCNTNCPGSRAFFPGPSRQGHSESVLSDCRRRRSSNCDQSRLHPQVRHPDMQLPRSTEDGLNTRTVARTRPNADRSWPALGRSLGRAGVPGIGQSCRRKLSRFRPTLESADFVRIWAEPDHRSTLAEMRIGPRARAAHRRTGAAFPVCASRETSASFPKREELLFCNVRAFPNASSACRGVPTSAESGFDQLWSNLGRIRSWFREGQPCMDQCRAMSTRPVRLRQHSACTSRSCLLYAEWPSRRWPNFGRIRPTMLEQRYRHGQVPDLSGVHSRRSRP